MKHCPDHEAPVQHLQFQTVYLSSITEEQPSLFTRWLVKNTKIRQAPSTVTGNASHFIIFLFALRVNI